MKRQIQIYYVPQGSEALSNETFNDSASADSFIAYMGDAVYQVIDNGRVTYARSYD